MVFKRKLTRGKLLAFFAGQPPCAGRISGRADRRYWGMMCAWPGTATELDRRQAAAR